MTQASMQYHAMNILYITKIPLLTVTQACNNGMNTIHLHPGCGIHALVPRPPSDFISPSLHGCKIQSKGRTLQLQYRTTNYCCRFCCHCLCLLSLFLIFVVCCHCFWCLLSLFLMFVVCCHCFWCLLFVVIVFDVCCLLSLFLIFVVCCHCYMQ